ncbi:MAG: hypothetical protein V8T00_09595 [Oscillospiraceae bacterium]
MTLNADGTVMVDEAGVRALADGWAAIYDIPNTNMSPKSEVDGYVPIQFLDVSYKVDCDALTKELRERLRTLDAGEVVPKLSAAETASRSTSRIRTLRSTSRTRR